MTQIQARAIEKAREEFVRAKKEMDRLRLSETRYRGVSTVKPDVPSGEIHGTFTYRGRTYTK